MEPFNNFCYGNFSFWSLFVLPILNSVAILNLCLPLARLMLLHAFINLHLWWVLILVCCLTCWVRLMSFYYIWLYLIRASAEMTSWMTLEYHSYVKLEVLYMFHKITTSFWPLVHVKTFLSYWYILVGFNHIFWLGWRFTAIENMEIISCEPFSYQYTKTLDLWLLILSLKGISNFY